MNKIKTRQVLLLIAAVCQYVAEELLTPPPTRAVTATRRKAPTKVRSVRAA